jgi:hypothetical protein
MAMIKYIITILLLFVFVAAKAQYVPNAGAYQYKGLKQTNSLQPPSTAGNPVTSVNAPDSNYAALYYNKTDTTWYQFNPVSKIWSPFRIAGGVEVDSIFITSIDSIFITNTDSIFIVSGNDTIFIGIDSSLQGTAKLYAGWGFRITNVDNPADSFYHPPGFDVVGEFDSSAVQNWIINVINTDTTINNNSNDTARFIVDTIANSPPGSATDGYKVLVGAISGNIVVANPTGAFVGHGEEVAELVGAVWNFTTADNNDQLIVDNTNNYSTWQYVNGVWRVTARLVRWSGDKGMGRNSFIGKTDKQPVFFRSWNKIFLWGDTTRYVYMPKMIGITSNNFAKYDSATGRMDYGVFRELVAGTNITITSGANSDTINSTGGGGSGGIDSVRKQNIGASSDSVMQIANSNTRSFAFRIPRVFNVKDYGAVGDNSTNDRNAIQAAINAAYAAPGAAAEVYFPDGVYKVTGLVTSVGGYNPNSVLYIPVNEQSDSSNRKTIIFRGESPPNFEEQGLTNVKRPMNGVILYTTTTGSGTNPSLLSSATGNENWFGFFNYTNVEIYNMGFRTHNASGMHALNLLNLTQERTDNIRIDLDSGLLTQTSPAGTGTIGFLMPKANNHAWLTNGKMMVSGYETGVLLGEHSYFESLIVAGTIHGIYGDDQSHSITVNSVDFECVKNSITVGDRIALNIYNYNTEHNFDGRWFDFSKDINYIGSGSHPTNVNITFCYVIESNVGHTGLFVASTQTANFKYSILTGDASATIPTNLGIGTITPTYDLTIQRNVNSAVGGYSENLSSLAGGASFFAAKADVALGTIQAFSSGYTGSAQLTNKFSLNSSAGDGLVIATTNTKPIDFYTNGVASSTTRRMSIQSGGSIDIPGSVGIGIVTPTAKLHVEGTAATGGAIGSITRNLSSTGEAYVGLYNDVSVSTTAGFAGFELFGSSYSDATLAGSGSFGARKSLFFIPGNGVTTGSSETVRFYAGGTNSSQERMRVTSTGVIVGSTSNLSSSALQTTSFSTAYVAKTTTYTATATDHTINCTSGTFTVTLPTAVSISGRQYTIVNSGSGTITIGTTSSQTFVNINATPTTLALGAVGAGAIVSYTVMSNGANWIVTGKVKNE